MIGTALRARAIVSQSIIILSDFITAKSELNLLGDIQ